ncbi:MAG: nicotinate-nucleotide--dimethylbenzimidazole phosphoribosyltransferase [Planctomycetes bacterium]|nr:nicotinate-nucleotide--dimethylbenzimidazole phosphoribosyltransferase [Planctomycetota bacterium]
MERLQYILNHIEDVSANALDHAKAAFNAFAIPSGSLGRLEELAILYAAAKGGVNHKIKHKKVFTMAGDHGVAAEGVSAFPQQVTMQMIKNFLEGGAAVNVLARHIGAKVIIVDCGVAADVKTLMSPNQCGNQALKIKKVGLGTKNMAVGPAMSRSDAIQSIEVGIEAFEEEIQEGLDIVGTGDMGIANTTPSSAILAVLGRVDVDTATGRGTGLDEESLQKKIQVIKKAIEVNKPNPHDPIDVLAKVGGYEIGGIAGLCLGAARHRIPVVLDGFISTAGAMIANALEPRVNQYLIASHVSAEKGHKLMLKHLGKSPLLDLHMRLGEGTGAILGISLVEAAVKLLHEMATFHDAGVSKPCRK